MDGDEESGFANNNNEEEEKSLSDISQQDEEDKPHKRPSMTMDHSEGTLEPGNSQRSRISIVSELPDVINSARTRRATVESLGARSAASNRRATIESLQRRSTVESLSSRSAFGNSKNMSTRFHSVKSNIGSYGDDDLFSGEYWIPPQNDDNLPIVVDFRCACFKLTDVSTVQFTTLIKFVLVFEWVDPRLRGMPITTNDLPADLWGPDMILENAQNDCRIIYDSFSLLDANEGRLKRTITYHGHIFTPMGLVDFPFDSADLGLKFISINNWRTLDGSRQGNDPVQQIYILRPMLDRDDVDFFLLGWGGKLQEFNVLGWSQNVANPSNPSIPIVFKFDIHLMRKSLFYIYKVLFPMWLITITSMASFAIDPLDIQGRLEVLFTLLLSTIAMVYVVQESIPKISFLTLVDKIVNVTLLNLALSVLFSFIISVSDNPGDLNWIFAFVNQGLYWILNILFMVPPLLRYRRKVQKYVKDQQELEEIRRLGPSGTALLDNRQSVHMTMRQSFKKKFVKGRGAPLSREEQLVAGHNTRTSYNNK